ncbi:hypothetical protein GYB22_01130 [bacterium]|nr:hypothetical protein [bacterium]
MEYSNVTFVTDLPQMYGTFKFYFLFLVVMSAASCVPINHITSPEVLDKSEQSIAFGAVIEPKLVSYDTALYGVQPQFTYRTGLGHGADFGIGIYGLAYPILNFDYKHYLVDRPRVDLTGDLHFFAGYKRPTGLKYNLIFGNERIFTSGGVYYFFTHQLETSKNVNWLWGLGAALGENKNFLVQGVISNEISLSDKASVIDNMPYYPQPYLSFGFSYQFNSRKRRN